MDKSIPYSPSRLDSTYFLKYNLGKYLDKAKDVIDVGCGRLFFFNFLKNTRFSGRYIGIDIKTSPAISSSKFSARTVEADFLNYSVPGKFDVAACLWVLEHIKKDKEAIRKINEILKPKGVLILAVPSVWSWPFEFGRHGYHYYRLTSLEKVATQSGFKIIESHSAAGLLGFLFMIFYNWPRYFLLVPALIIYKVIKTLGLINTSWQDFSAELISSTLYRYHRTKKAIAIHNEIVGTIVKLDNKFKIFPASYILVLKKL